MKLSFNKQKTALVVFGLLIFSIFAGITGCSNPSTQTSKPGVNKEDPLLISYNTPQQWANWGAVLQEFTKTTGIQAPNDNKNSGQTITALTAEKDKPVADIAYYGIVFGFSAADNGLVDGYKPPHFDEIPAGLKDPDGRWMTVHYGAVAFIVNKDALGQVPVPQSWADLLKPEYKGKVGYLDPTSAAIGYSVAAAVNTALGGTLDNWQPGLDYLTKLAKNEVINPKQTATAKVLKGEIPILIDADFNGYNLKYVEKGPIEVVIPNEGSIKIPYSISLVKNAPHPNNAKKLLDYVLSDDGQKIFAQGFVRPIRNITLSDDIKSKFLPDSDYARLKDVDFDKMNKAQTAFIDLYKKQVLGQ